MVTKDTTLFMEKNVNEIYFNYLKNQMDSTSMKLIMEKRKKNMSMRLYVIIFTLKKKL
jgi:hypothetical protein